MTAYDPRRGYEVAYLNPEPHQVPCVCGHPYEDHGDDGCGGIGATLIGGLGRYGLPEEAGESYCACLDFSPMSPLGVTPS